MPVVRRTARNARLRPNQVSAAPVIENSTAVSRTGVMSAIHASGLVSVSITDITPMARTESNTMSDHGCVAYAGRPWILRSNVIADMRSAIPAVIAPTI